MNRFKIVSGYHMTATERKLLAYILEYNGRIMSAKTPRIFCSMWPADENGAHLVKFRHKERDDYGRPVERSSHFTIKLI